ncbi:SDR family NAD(P)-dependent oxidoreductase [Streptomyces subrutilus]|uniref:SDR family NAD(P)-dependent oxidoreductase n=2 Tax=Streptomyces subrutilus TaxID=36818 RepID=A0A5P2UYX6_9ACTN|nr:SDR family NAD(P)-dependent oxidoreductase [Streptomyces subrutilus]QEU83295.1 SDR family NAD(P)-dependent oxidoreductase [Streptomyces subrutilus]GGZ95523.1 short-chain dehydrogenase/reductase [Streptomyces subrutilus]
MERRRWLVTGCSSGLGRALAAAAARAGDEVAVTARRTAALDELAREWPGRITPIALELRDPAQCEEAVRMAAERMGGIDVLVNNAGGGLFGTVEEVSDAELRDQVETLLVGPWRLTRLVLPLMRAQGRGHVVNVSSLGGRMAVPGLASYVAGKYALEGMSQALAAEAAPFGVRVTVVEPGVYATRYGASLAEAAHRLPVYAEATGAMLGDFRSMEDNTGFGRPEEFADAVLALVAADGPTPLRVPVGADAYLYLEAAEAAAREEFAAARALVRPAAPA